jgi:hypothetical protein
MKYQMKEDVMKTKKMIVVGLALFASLLLVVGPASAALKWGDYNVEQAGTNDQGEIEMKLRPVAGGVAKVFYAPTGEENRMLSVALTAISLGYPVKAYVDFNINKSEIVALRIAPPSE